EYAPDRQPVLFPIAEVCGISDPGYGQVHRSFSVGGGVLAQRVGLSPLRRGDAEGAEFFLMAVLHVRLEVQKWLLDLTVKAHALTHHSPLTAHHSRFSPLRR